MSTNPLIMDVMGTRPAGQGGPAPTGGVPENHPRGQHHQRYHPHQHHQRPGPFHPQGPNAFSTPPERPRRSAAGS